MLNNAVNATVLFLDLRGFTRTSEGHISERDLTRELYTVFDDFVPIVERFGGKVDKYLGDGMMVTWGTARADPLDPLNALRTAILCQESLAGKRQEGRTLLQDGHRHPPRPRLPRALHRRGRRDPVDGDRPQREPGRPALLRGQEADRGRRRRLRGGRRAGERRDPGGHRRPEGTLFNEGIAISRDTLAQIENHLALVHGETGIEYEDETIGRRILIRYAGDAKFKGVRSSHPVFDVSYEARG